MSQGARHSCSLQLTPEAAAAGMRRELIPGEKFWRDRSRGNPDQLPVIRQIELNDCRLMSSATGERAERNGNKSGEMMEPPRDGSLKEQIEIYASD
jgi:hypothetical protein